MVVQLLLEKYLPPPMEEALARYCDAAYSIIR